MLQHNIRLKSPVMTTFKELRERLLIQGRLYEDPHFLPSRWSIYADGSDTDIEWKRPAEICVKPEFITEGISRFDLTQGKWGDCWFVAAIAALATKPDLFRRVVPLDQGFDDEKYAGIFHFNFWWDGKWTEVVVDDWLPVRDDKLVFGNNTEEPNEMWGALIEKAYAKLHGSYAGIYAGFVRDALVNFTGGISESYNLKKKHNVPHNLFKIMLESFRSGSLLGCGIYPQKGATTEIKLETGLYAGHAYTITNVVEINIYGIRKQLLRVRNPWGQGEWTGPWSDRSKEWTRLSESEKVHLSLVVQEEGEFWIEFSDWLQNFSVVDIVHTVPTLFQVDYSSDKQVTRIETWQETSLHGEWVRGLSAGGAGVIGESDMLYRNPQYNITLDRPIDQDKCECIVSLMQKYRDPPIGVAKSRKLLIGFDLFKVQDGLSLPLDGTADPDTVLVKKFQTRTNQREISCRISLEPGNYVLIPNTLKPNEEGKFLLRIFTKADASSRIMTDGTVLPAVQPQEKTNGRRLDLTFDAFLKYAGSDYVVDYLDLRKLIRDISETWFGRVVDLENEASRSLLAKHDTNKNGSLTFGEVKKLLAEIELWRHMFDKYDVNKENRIDFHEFRKLFLTLDYSIGFGVLRSIAVRFGGKMAVMSFEDFILCTSRLISMIATFKELQLEKTMSLDEWLAETVLL